MKLLNKNWPSFKADSLFSQVRRLSIKDRFNSQDPVKLAAITFAALVVIYVALISFWPVKGHDIRIPKGSSVSEIAMILKDAGLIRSRGLFVAYAFAINADRKIQAGRYSFPNNITMPEIVYMMSHGQALPDEISVFIPEGYNTWEIDKRLQDLGFIRSGEFSRQFLSVEGYLFPDTYNLAAEMATFPSKSSALIDSLNRDYMVKTMAEKMKANFDSKTLNIFQNLSESKKREVIIVASLLEKEARMESDMKIVAGIIYKRLSRGMLLQIDASVSYGACLRVFNDPKVGYCDVTQVGVGKEIKIDSRYNTYMRKGLPPGPISNPGLKSINAALNPTQSQYLYYLSTRDGGDIIFSKTGSEHVANRKKYLGF